LGIKIVGTGRKLPGYMVTNKELAEFLDTGDEWITSKTGIKSRAVCTDESLTDLAYDAVNIALDKAGLLPSDIDLVIGATMSGDYLMPSLACCVLERFGVSCPAFDVNAACSGFVYALDTADAYINCGKAKTVVIIAADMMSRMLDWNDRSTSILFGDGAAACVITKGDSLKYIRTTAFAHIDPLFAKAGNGSNPFAKSPQPKGFLEMQGQHVYKFAVKTVEHEIQSALTAANLKAQDVDYFILHQANARIIDGARARLKLPAEKFPMNIQHYGNMSAASIPVLIDEMLEEGKIKPGDVLMLIGFGAGMTAGTALMVWE